MAEYFVKMAGNDGADGLTELTAWRTVPGISGANAVVSGDIINIEDGYEIFGLQLNLPANNLTYRVFGKNTGRFLSLKLPVYVGRVPLVHEQKIVREEGVHEGYWTLHAGGITTSGSLNYSSRTGCVVEDICILDSVNNNAAIVMGTSGQAQEVATLRRSQVINAVQGVSNFRPDTLVEYCLFKDTASDGFVVATGATQSLHAGKFNTIRFNNFINNGYSTVLDAGDAFQLNASSGYAGTLKYYGNYVYKPSSVKQGCFLADVVGRAYITGNYFDGVEEGAAQIGLTDLLAGSRTVIAGNYWKQAKTNTNPIIRIAGGVIENTATLIVASNFVDIREHAGLFSWGSDNAAPSGTVIITNNTVLGRAFNGLSWGANIGMQTTGTIAGTASLTATNNLFIGASPYLFRLPTGGLNDSRWVMENNFVDGALNFAAVGPVASEVLYTKDGFEAAHSTAVDNMEDTYTVAAGTGAGKFHSYDQDLNGVTFWNPPSVGCYEYQRPRVSRT